MVGKRNLAPLAGRRRWLVAALGLLAMAAIAGPVEDPLQRLRAAGELRIALPSRDLAPYVSHPEGTGPVGLDAALAETLAWLLGVRARFLPVPGDETAVLEELAAGRAHLAMGRFEATPELARRVAVSRPYAAPARALLFNRLTVARAGISPKQLLRRVDTQVVVLRDEAGADYLKLAYPGHRLETVAGLGTAVQRLLEDRAPLLLSDEARLRHWLTVHPDVGLSLGFTALPGTAVPLAIALPWREQRLLGWINGTLEILEADGTLAALRRANFGFDSEVAP
jgi:ABC-type amino acid transport substrate-binding protein